jgi:predicted membrane channel-forming protein YqfA (hemolysin III family)
MADHSPEASGGNIPGEDGWWVVISLVVRMVGGWRLVSWLGWLVGGGYSRGEDGRWATVSLEVRMVMGTISIVIGNDLCTVFDLVGHVRIAMDMAVGMVGTVIYGMANSASRCSEAVLGMMRTRLCTMW